MQYNTIDYQLKIASFRCVIDDKRTTYAIAFSRVLWIKLEYLIQRIGISSIAYKITVRWMLQDFTDD